MSKKIISIALVFILSISLISEAALAYRDFTEPQQKAEALKSLQLFQGVSDSDLALNRAPSRIEALVMFIRLIGGEGEAMSRNWDHPFRDVPEWADHYVGYAYENGYTNGVSKYQFGSNDTAGCAMYLTLVLRALAYSDGTNGDFTWNDPYSLANKIGLLTGSEDTSNFLRADVALISWNALFLPMNGGNKALGDILIMGNVFTKAQFDKAVASVGTASAASAGTSNASGNQIKLGKYICSTDANGFTYDKAYCPYITLNSDKSCVVYVNMGEGMATGKGVWSSEALDSGEIGIHLKITTKSWCDSNTYSFLYYNNMLILSDGGMGITPVDSDFKL